LTSQEVLSKYTAGTGIGFTPVSQEVCKRCRYLTKKEERYYCKLLQSFLAGPTLSQPCGLLEAKK
jgi:hypothetical protein